MTAGGKYEAAAGQYVSNRENLYNHIEINAMEAFKAGASFAEKDRREEAESDQTKLWCIILELVDSPLIGQKYIDDLKSKFTIIQK